MNNKTAKILHKINNDFYRNNAASFSATRKFPWLGWQRCINVLSLKHSNDAKLKVLDLASGNLRFARFLIAVLPHTNIEYYAVDNCDDLVLPHLDNAKAGVAVKYQELDILSVVLSSGRLPGHLVAPICDLSVCFGFMHHIPGQAQRLIVLTSLIEQTCTGGYILVSFWQFLKNARLKEKAQATHTAALKKFTTLQLDDNDFFLGWKSSTNQYRYCHSFFENEIDELIEQVSDKASLISRFVADGRADDLNSYVILQVK